jgi:DNA (cytosine-5)-methyltransferase 1
LLGVEGDRPNPDDVFRRIRETEIARHRNLKWAIGDLVDQTESTAFDTPSPHSDQNAARIKWLFENSSYDLPDNLRPACHRDGGHTYKSVYGRLRWDRPAQTITTGFLSMGQGRYVHPSRRSTLTPHEAARLQCFPDFFDFSATNKRSAWSRLIGNAVPPLLTLQLGRILITSALDQNPGAH